MLIGICLRTFYYMCINLLLHADICMEQQLKVHKIRPADSWINTDGKKRFVENKKEKDRKICGQLPG